MTSFSQSISAFPFVPSISSFSNFSCCCAGTGVAHKDIFTDYESNKLALGMLADAPLETFLREHPQITSIRFCLDGDEPGRKAAAELMRKYYELGYEVEDCPPPAGYKDYNEWLVAAKLNLNQMNQRADEPVRA